MKTSLKTIHTAACTPASPVQFLSYSDISEAVGLIEKIRNCGTLEQSYHLKPKTYKDLAGNLAHNFPLLGIKSAEGVLVGFAMICPLENTDVVIMKSVCVEPACRSLGFGGALIQEAEKWATDNHYKYLVAKVALDNGKSLNMYQKQGFEASLSGYDEEGDYKFCFMHKSPSPNIQQKHSLFATHAYSMQAKKKSPEDASGLTYNKI